MKQMVFSKMLTVVACVLMLGIWAPTLAVADQAQYFYDPLGRLVGVVDGQGNLATYQYDAVGNLLSISRGAATAPTITSISPTTFVQGQATPVTITGTGLLLGTLNIANPDVIISGRSQTDTTITATFTVLNPTTSGQTAVTVQAPGGMASVPVSIAPQPTPIITQLSPTTGPPNTVVTITGTGFGNKPGGTSVTFAGVAGTRVQAPFLEASLTTLKVRVPPNAKAATGQVTVQVGALLSTGVNFVVPGIETMVTTATQGIPANPAQPSANVSQLIQLHGAGFIAGSTLIYPTSVNGVVGTGTTPFFSVSADGTSGTVSVPADATTGHWTLTGGVGPGVPLQIVPTVARLILPAGETLRAGVVLTIEGRGFMAGATNVIFPGVAAPVASTGVTNVFGELHLTVPVPVGVTAGQITATTNGGTSNGLAVPVLQSLTASSLRGIPANATVASANVGQALQLNGMGLSNSTTFVNVPVVNDAGVGSIAVVTPSIGPNGTTAFITVPQSAVTGQITISGLGAVPLQVVPNIFSITFPAGQSYVPGVLATINGSGFKAGGTTVAFVGAAPVQAATVSNGGTVLTVTVPSGTVNGPVTVTVDSSIGVFDTVAPRVTAVFPAGGLTNVPLNSRVALLFSKPIKRETVTTNSVRLDGPSGQVLGTVTVAADGRSAVFAPIQALAADSAYAMTYTPFIGDVAGNSIANAGSSSFTTGTATDSTPPSVSVVSPANAATAVPTNSLIRLYMSEALLPTTVDPQVVQLIQNGVPIPATVAIEQNNTVIRLQPVTSLQANTAYTVTVASGLADLAGNALAAQFTSTFSTGAAADATAPTVSTRTPADGATNVASDTTIVVTFSEAIEPATVDATTTFTLTGGGISGTIPGIFSFTPDGRTVTFTPLFTLFAGQTFFLTLSGIEDASGNRLVETTSSFSTAGGSGGGVVPAFATVIPAPNALFANGQTITRVTIDNIADSNGFLVPDSTQIAITAAPAFQQTSAGGTILGGTTNTADPRFKLFTTTSGRVRFDYQSPALVLAPGFSASSFIQVANLTATGAPSNLIGTSLITLVTSQTATISFNPTTLFPNGTSQAEVSVVVRDPINTLDDFGRPIPAGTVMGVGVLSAQGPLGTINGGTVAPDPRYKLFNAKTGGIIDLTYTAPNLVQGPTDGNSDMFSAIPVDPAGNLLGAFGFSFIGLVTGGCVDNECVPGGFTGPLPKILALSPGPGESNVGTTAPIMAQFSQSIDPASVTALTFSVSSGGTPILGTYALSAGPNGPNTIVTFTPNTPWTAGTVVDVTLTSGIRNTAGNPLLASAFNSFSIDAGPDTTGPSIVRASLGNGLTNVPHSAVMNIQFNQPVNAVSLNSSTFMVSAGGTPISGRISLSNGEFGVNTIATFIQDQLLASDTLYTITFNAGVTDSSGNALTPGFTSTFRTAAGTPVTDVGQPNVDTFSPPNGQQEVPLNPTVTVRTDKAINPITLNSGSFDVSSNQGSVEGTVVVMPDQKNWTFTPTAPLAPTTNHSLDVTNGLRDIAGSRLSSGVGSSFVTGTALANPAGPQLTSVTPQNNATNVFLNQPITIRFSEPLAVSTVTSQTVMVSRGGALVSGVLTLLENNRAIRWVPANSGTLAPSALHTITITPGVTGLAINPLATQVTSSFTTGTATDTTAPAVTSFDPADGAQNVPRNQQIHVTFNEPLDPASVFGFEPIHTDSGSPVAGALTLSPDRTILQFVPTFPLFSGQTFEIPLGGITDSIGNQMSFVSSMFTTAVAPGTILSNVPDSASLSSSPTNLIADGQQTSVITITSIRRGGIPVPDGTSIGVTTYPAFNGNSFPGTLLGGTPSGADSRFVLYSVVGGAVTLTYQTPSLPSGTNLDSWVQVAGVDAAGAPMNLIGQRRLRLFGTGGGQ
jgi:YD repeat-containing protein